jgi:hypothetical protein
MTDKQEEKQNQRLTEERVREIVREEINKWYRELFECQADEQPKKFKFASLKYLCREL